MAGGLYRLIFLTHAYAVQMLNRKNMAPCMEAEKNMKENMTRKIKGWKFESNILIIDHLTN